MSLHCNIGLGHCDTMWDTVWHNERQGLWHSVWIMWYNEVQTVTQCVTHCHRICDTLGHNFFVILWHTVTQYITLCISKYDLPWYTRICYLVVKVVADTVCDTVGHNVWHSVIQCVLRCDAMCDTVWHNVWHNMWHSVTQTVPLCYRMFTWL